jgi:hypothetical protein
MAHTYRQVHRTTTVREGDDDIIGAGPASYTAARIVSLIGGIIMTVLALRFLLSLLGANRGNTFASVIYNVSHPFVAPFFGLFNYQPQFGVVRFEFETLIAIAFWGFLTWMVVRLITIGETD